MDRKVLIAMVMIMMVLLLDRFISPKFYRQEPKPAPVGQTGGQPGSPGPGSASAPAGTPAVAPDAGTSSAPAGGAPPSGAAGTLSSGTVLTKPSVAPAPTEIREIKTDHFRATVVSDGGSIAHWVLDAYEDNARK